MNYKGMDLNMKCRGFQYEVGKEYETGSAEVCESGFHACEYPLDVFSYYPPAGSRFFEVEQSGDISRSDGDTKVASTKIKIGAEIGIAGLVKAAIEYTKERCTEEPVGCATGYRGASCATGDLGASCATGNRGASCATGNRGASCATGDRGASCATGNRGASCATGDLGASCATGDLGASCATGNRGASCATGYQGAASATGYQGASCVTGDRGAASATGKASVALACGIDSMAKGALGCAICVVERGKWDGETYPIKAIKAAIVDGKKIKADTWYTLKGGKFVEVKADD